MNPEIMESVKDLTASAKHYMNEGKSPDAHVLVAIYAVGAAIVRAIGVLEREMYAASFDESEERRIRRAERGQ